MRGTLHLLRADELALWVAAQGALKPRHHVPSWLRHHGLERERPTRCSTRSRPRSTAAAHARGAGRRGRARERHRGARRQAARRLRRPAEAGRFPRRPVLRPQRRPQRAVRAAGPVAGAAAGDRSRRGDARRSRAATSSVYGPATRETFARWFGITSAAQAGKWLAMLGDDAVEVEVEGKRALMLAADVEEAAAARARGRRAAAAGVRPLRRRRAARRRRRARRRTNAAASIGRRAGCRPFCWSTGGWPACGRTSGAGSAVAVEVEPFKAVEPWVKAGVEAEANALAAFIGGELQLTWA